MRITVLCHPGETTADGFLLSPNHIGVQVRYPALGKDVPETTMRAAFSEATAFVPYSAMLDDHQVPLSDRLYKPKVEGNESTSVTGCVILCMGTFKELWDHSQGIHCTESPYPDAETAELLRVVNAPKATPYSAKQLERLKVKAKNENKPLVRAVPEDGDSPCFMCMFYFPTRRLLATHQLNCYSWCGPCKKYSYPGFCECSDLPKCYDQRVSEESEESESDE